MVEQLKDILKALTVNDVCIYTCVCVLSVNVYDVCIVYPYMLLSTSSVNIYT